jgi:hypothetical protein
LRDTGLIDINNNVISEGDKMTNALSKGFTVYDVKFYKGNWWLFDKDLPWMMLIPSCNSNKIAQYKVV